MDNYEYNDASASDDAESNEEFYTSLFWLLTLPPEELSDSMLAVYHRTQKAGNKPVELMDAWATECREEIEDFIYWNREVTGGSSFI